MIDIELIGAPAFSVALAGDTFTYASINQRLVDLLGVPRDGFVGLTPETLLPTDYAATVLRQYRRCVADRRAVEFESFFDAPGGGRWWHTTVSPVLDGEEGRVVLLVGVAVDISARKAADRVRLEVDTRLTLAMDLLEGGFWHYSIPNRRFTTSPQLGRLVGGDGPLDGPGYTAFVLEEDRAALDIGALVSGRTEASAEEYRIRTGAGALRWVSCKRRLTRDEAGRPENVIGVVVDITEQKSLRAVLAAEAATDPLTGLVNRRGFEALGDGLAEAARAGGLAFGLLLLDLDRFKPVNDTHGHAVGDAVLREVAGRLRRHTRPGDTAARLGGDEFAVLVAEADADVLADMSRRIVEAVGRPIAAADRRIEIGASVGAALWRAGDLAALMARADAALLAVKRGGRGAWRIAA